MLSSCFSLLHFQSTHSSHSHFRTGCPQLRLTLSVERPAVELAGEHVRGTVGFATVEPAHDGSRNLEPTFSGWLDQVCIVGLLAADKTQVNDGQRTFKTKSQDDVIEHHEGHSCNVSFRRIQIAVVNGADRCFKSQPQYGFYCGSISGLKLRDSFREQRKRFCG